MNSQKNQLTKEEILVIDFINFLVKNQKLIAITTGATILFFFLIFLVRPNYYMATATVLPVLEKTTSREKTGQIPAALLNLTGQKSEQKAIILGTLEARDFIRNYVTKNNILPILFSSDWDAKKKQWKSPEDEPTLRTMTEKFKDLFLIKEADLKEYFELSLKWKDPELAAKWLNLLIKALNDHFREKTIATTIKNIDYLNLQIQRNSVIEVRQNLSELLRSEILKNMIAQNEEAYAVDVIDQAAVPEKKYSPKLLLHIGLGLLLGFLLGIFIAAIKSTTTFFTRIKRIIKKAA